MITSRLIPILLFFTLSCQTKPKQETQTASAAETVDSTASLAKRPGPDTPRSAADRLVRALYFEHNKTENPMREVKDRALVDQFFVKSTGDLIWNDAKATQGKINRSKINLLYNEPDASIKKTWVLPAVIGGSKAIVYVTFENKSKPEEMKVTMQQVAGRWRIADIQYPNGKSLTQLLN
ncbi:hypothetical protein [Spirosoma radiotolerans]|uniref:DUF3828 domain-containing protein n=1 Tax=Spirosoma radiotolerans TaxID=1379870 RepID=A0A0E3V9W7_9BACT|nr:hypothetical protein [Spirosoma radiotolerans]AKD57541.1 hypothetical protein SD10_24250 [Spirosoma radiotolerans]